MPNRRRLVFVPLDQATVGPGYLKVAYDRKLYLLIIGIALFLAALRMRRWPGRRPAR